MIWSYEEKNYEVPSRRVDQRKNRPVGRGRRRPRKTKDTMLFDPCNQQYLVGKGLVVIVIVSSKQR